jgi:serine protease Do
LTAAAEPSRPAFLGIETQEITPAVKQQFNITAESGIVVMDVIANTPAAKAGLQKGDVITAVDGKEVAQPDDLRRAVRTAGAGKDMVLKIMRGKEAKDVKARLEEVAAAPEKVNPPVREFLPGPLGTMERRINELEKRVQELEKKLNEKK